MSINGLGRKFAAVLLLFGLAACSSDEPPPVPSATPTSTSTAEPKECKAEYPESELVQMLIDCSVYGDPDYYQETAVGFSYEPRVTAELVEDNGIRKWILEGRYQPEPAPVTRAGACERDSYSFLEMLAGCSVYGEPIADGDLLWFGTSGVYAEHRFYYATIDDDTWADAQKWIVSGFPTDDPSNPPICKDWYADGAQAVADCSLYGDVWSGEGSSSYFGSSGVSAWRTHCGWVLSGRWQIEPAPPVREPSRCLAEYDDWTRMVADCAVFGTPHTEQLGSNEVIRFGSSGVYGERTDDPWEERWVVFGRPGG